MLHASKFGSLSRRRPIRLLAAGGALLLACSLAACAPEPGEEAGKTGKEDSQTVNPETKWGGDRDLDTEYEYTTELPKSLPSDIFSLPAGAPLEDAGERGVDQWFVVLRARDQQQSDELWNAILELSHLVVEDEQQTAEGGRQAKLSSVAIVVEAMTIPQPDGTIRLSYDIQRW